MDANVTMEPENLPFLGSAQVLRRAPPKFGFGFPGPPFKRLCRCHFGGAEGMQNLFKVCLVLAILLVILGWSRLNFFPATQFHPSVEGHIQNNSLIRRKHLTPHHFCLHQSAPSSIQESDPTVSGITEQQHGSFKTRVPTKVLLLTKTSFSAIYKTVTEMLVATRIGYKASVAGKNLPDLIKLTKGTGKYGVVFFEDFRSYLTMDRWNRELLDKYCKSFDVGIVAFLPPDGSKSKPLVDPYGGPGQTPRTLPFILRSAALKNVSLTASSPMFRIVKSGGLTWQDSSSQGLTTLFSLNNNSQEGYSVIAWAGTNKDDVIVLTDAGQHDGIPKVLFGTGSYQVKKRRKGRRQHGLHWLQKLLFLDGLWWASGGKIDKPSLERRLLVDIDDVFVGKHRFTLEDVTELLHSQQRLSLMVPGFHYNLGFSGSTFKSGRDDQNLADDLLIQLKDEFWWFPHEWQHLQPHLFDNATHLMQRMELNREFAREKGLLSIVNTNRYAVSPHHSGIYPVHQQLFDAWSKVWGIEVASTEEYPHLYPARLRKGFVHAKSGIQVLPRQTSGLFTKNLYYSEYIGGARLLEQSIAGGELFETILYNPVLIFMTHMPNYAFDRLAPYTFESVFSMIKCWTNLRLTTLPPSDLAQLYFGELYPEEKVAIWGNPCDDERHLAIWSKAKSCTQLPDFLVIGPQKTGTTALYNFLQIHPAIQSNLPSPDTFEELQFFSNKENYEKGIDWYMEFFPPITKHNGSMYLFEKSANYFDKEVVPQRAHKLLKDAKLVAILISPVKRAYSWYQHMLAHNDPIASTHTFHEVVTATAKNSSKALRSLQARCLDPGKYASHLERWMTFYHSSQLTIVDGEELKSDPIAVMNRLQHFLSVKPFLDYKDHLVFNLQKGFFCQVLSNGNTKCLGKGKGRHYEPMEPQTMKYLKDFYRLYNEALLKLLKRLGYEVPYWLESDLLDLSESNPD